ncbi:MAG TPA: hypothetical protein PLZ26_10255, partial [Bacteroidia bacterium]|nr:hypothetical protein [Bacteroidia bacterium]
KLLETEIKKDSANVNFRILRLIIQENCPVFLKYNTNLDDDAVFVQRNFDKLSNKIRDLLITYSKNSKHLKLKESE